MASLILRTRILTSTFLRACSAGISTTSSNFVDIEKVTCQKDAKQIKKKLAFMKREDAIEKTERDKATITVCAASDTSPIGGVPEAHIKNRRVKIFMPTKNSMQSGTDNTRHWAIEFETRQRWENPLMGWSSSGDPLSNLHVEFVNKNEAIAFCEKNGWPWFIEEPHKHKKIKPKNYAINFSWDKRTRVSTK